MEPDDFDSNGGDEAMPRADYVREKLGTALDSLATNSGGIQERLVSVWLGSLGRLQAEDFGSVDQRELFERISVALRKLNAPETGSVIASTQAMDDSTAQAIASDVLELFRHVHGIRWGQP